MKTLIGLTSLVSGLLACICWFLGSIRFSNRRIYFLSIIFAAIAGSTYCSLLGQNDFLFSIAGGVITATFFAFSIWWTSYLQKMNMGTRKKK